MDSYKLSKGSTGVGESSGERKNRNGRDEGKKKNVGHQWRSRRGVSFGARGGINFGYFGHFACILYFI